MSPSSLTINPQQSLVPERSVREVHVGVGNVVITPPDGVPIVANADQSYDAGGAASVAIYSAEGARVLLCYADEPEGVEIGGPRPTTATNLTQPQKTTAAPKKATKKPAAKKPAKKAKK